MFHGYPIEAVCMGGSSGLPSIQENRKKQKKKQKKTHTKLVEHLLVSCSCRSDTKTFDRGLGQNLCSGFRTENR